MQCPDCHHDIVPKITTYDGSIEFRRSVRLHNIEVLPCCVSPIIPRLGSLIELAERFPDETDYEWNPLSREWIKYKSGDSK